MYLKRNTSSSSELVLVFDSAKILAFSVAPVDTSSEVALEMAVWGRPFAALSFASYFLSFSAASLSMAESTEPEFSPSVTT